MFLAKLYLLLHGLGMDVIVGVPVALALAGHLFVRIRGRAGIVTLIPPLPPGGRAAAANRLGVLASLFFIGLHSEKAMKET